MKKIITLLFMVGLFITAYSQTYHTITIDGINSGWSANETFTDCSSADNAYFTWDVDYLYFGISDPEADYGKLATFMYFDIDPDGTGGTTGAYAWGENITVPFNADYVFVWKNESGNDYIEVRHWDGSSWVQVASSTSSSLNSGDYVANFAVGTDYREVKIKRSTIGSPSAIKVVSFTEQQYGSNYRYFAWPSEGWTDGNRTAGQSIPHYRGFILTDYVSVNNANYYDDNIYSWTGNTDNDWGTSTNWSGSTTPTSSDLIIIGSGNPVVNESPSTPGSCFDILVKTGASLTINYGKALTVNGTLTNNAGISGLVIQSVDIGNGSLIFATGTPSATVQRYIAGYSGANYGWHEICSPVDMVVTSGPGWAPGGFDDLYYWDEATNQWMNYKVSAFTFTQGQGYLVAYESSGIKEFTGFLRSTSITHSNLSRDNSNGYGWHLLGNPFSSAIEWNNNVDWVFNHIGNVPSVWDESSATYVNPSVGDPIPSTNGFFVQVADGYDGTNTITIPASARVHNSANNYKNATSNSEANTLKMTVTTDANTFYNKIRVGFKADATQEWDIKYDAHKMYGAEAAPELWTISNGEEFSVNTLPFNQQSVDLPLNFKAGADGNYTITFDGIDSFDANSSITLEDLFAGKTNDIRQNAIYNYSAATGDETNRFVLHFYGVTSTPEIDKPNSNKALIYSYNNNIIVKALDKQLNGSVEVVNILGQTMETTAVSNSSFFTINTNLNKGVYIVRYTETDGYTQSQKVILN